MSSVSSGNCSRTCLRRFGSGRRPAMVPSSLKALLKGSRSDCAAYSNVSNCCITGSGSSAGAGRFFTSATHFSRLEGSVGELVTLRPQAPSNGSNTSTMSIRDVRMSATPLLLLGLRLGLAGRFFLVQVPVGLDRAGELQRDVPADAAAVRVARLQRDVVHGQDDH